MASIDEMAKRSVRTLIFVSSALFACSAHSEELKCSCPIPPEERQVRSYDAKECTSDVAARIEFLQDKLEDRRGYATWYRRGWLGFYTVGLGYTTFQAASKDDSGKRAVEIASATKAVYGIVRQLRTPSSDSWKDKVFCGAPSARMGAGNSSGPAADEVECSNRLEYLERRLCCNAKESEKRTQWKPHVINLGIHSLVAVAVGEGFGARSEAWQSAGLGLAVGEAVIWSFPWQAKKDHEEYEQRFPASGLPSTPRVSWHIEVGPLGPTLQVLF